MKKEVLYFNKSVLIILIAIFALLISCKPQNTLQNGDIVFHVSKSGQCSAIQKATGSLYCHMGIVYFLKGKPYVFEAVQPVKLTPLQEWIERGVNKHYVVKRLKNSIELLTDENQLKIKDVSEKYIGKPYDIYFQWSDEEIYCSELVWKIYNEALGIQIGELKTIGEFDLTSPEVQEIMKKRFKDDIPMDEKVISPGDMFDSDLLYKVLEEGKICTI